MILIEKNCHLESFVLDFVLKNSSGLYNVIFVLNSVINWQGELWKVTR